MYKVLFHRRRKEKIIMANTELTEEEIKHIIYEELPKILKQHPEVRFTIWNMLSEEFASKKQTEDRFEILLKEMNDKFDRVFRKLDEYSKRFEENDKKFEQLFKKLEENDKRFEEYDRRFEEYTKRFEEHDRRFEEYTKRFEEHDRRFEELLKEIRRVDHRIDRTIGALGARWGFASEYSFREAIKYVLEEIAHKKVERYIAYDHEGYVFGRPDQVEIDILIKNGEIWIMEIKSSTSKADVSIFARKVEFYERHENKKVSRKILISPMIEPKAREFAEELGIQTFTAPEDIKEIM